MNDGIILTNNGKSWVSVANPLRWDTVSAMTYAQDKYDPPQLAAKSGVIAIAPTAAVGLIAALAGLPILLSILCGLVALPIAWLILQKRVQYRATKFRAAVSAHTEGLGPRRIVRGEFLPGPRAYAADHLVMGAVRILQSEAYRRGALGDTNSTYEEILESTFSLLSNLQSLEQAARNQRQLASQAKDEQAHIKFDELAEKSDLVWTDTLQPKLVAQREFVDAVADLDTFLRSQHALTREGNSPTTATLSNSYNSDLEALASRVATARESATAVPSDLDCDDSPL